MSVGVAERQMTTQTPGLGAIRCGPYVQEQKQETPTSVGNLKPSDHCGGCGVGKTQSGDEWGMCPEGRSHVRGLETHTTQSRKESRRCVRRCTEEQSSQRDRLSKTHGHACTVTTDEEQHNGAHLSREIEHLKNCQSESGQAWSRGRRRKGWPLPQNGRRC